MKKIIVWTMLIVGLIVLAGCGSGATPSGKYVNRDNPNEYLELYTGNAFDMVEGGTKVSSMYEMKDNIITLRLPSGTIAVTIKDNTIVDKNGKTWVKQ